MRWSKEADVEVLGEVGTVGTVELEETVESKCQKEGLFLKNTSIIYSTALNDLA